MSRDEPDGPRLIRWSRGWAATAARRSTGRLAELARRPHHLVATGFAAGLAAAPAPRSVVPMAAATAAAISAASVRSSGGRALPITALAIAAVLGGVGL